MLKSTQKKHISTLYLQLITEQPYSNLMQTDTIVLNLVTTQKLWVACSYQSQIHASIKCDMGGITQIIYFIK